MKAAQLFPCLLAIATLACLPPKRQVEFEAGLNRWVGQSVSAYILANDQPTQSSPRTGGGKTHVFTKSRRQSSDSNHTTYTGSVGGVSTNFHQVSANLYCRVILETDARDIIQSVRYEGNDCW